MIPPAERAALQRNLVLSHAGGVGPALAEAETRAMMLLLAAVAGPRRLGRATERGRDPGGVPEPRGAPRGARAGLGGIVGRSRPARARGGLPDRRGRGGVGRSPGAAPESALQAAGARPLALETKEGLALLNGTHLMAGPGRAGRAGRRPAGAAGRRGRRHVAGSADGHQRGVRRAHPRAAAASRRSRRWPPTSAG
mgnify:CR=1 FL=1